MIVQNLGKQKPFTTKDGSGIRGILDRTNAPVQNQSLAEATLPPTTRTQRHHHKLCEEFYFILEGTGGMEIDGLQRTRSSNFPTRQTWSTLSPMKARVSTEIQNGTKMHNSAMRLCQRAPRTQT